MRLFAVVTLVFSVAVFSAYPVHAMDPLAIVKKTKMALEPDRSSTSDITVTSYQGSQQVSQWTGAVVRDRVNRSRYILSVILAPKEARGMAMLSREQNGQLPDMWVYTPAINRVTMLSPDALAAPFFGTDFTFADIGFMTLEKRYKYLGAAERDGARCYEIEALPPPERYEASHLIAWIDQANFLPVERDFFGYAKRPWRVEKYSHVKEIQGIATITRITMEDRSSGNRTDFEFTNVKYDNKLPEDIFDPTKLSRIADEPFWKNLDSR